GWSHEQNLTRRRSAEWRELAGERTSATRLRTDTPQTRTIGDSDRNRPTRTNRERQETSRSDAGCSGARRGTMEYRGERPCASAPQRRVRMPGVVRQGRKNLTLLLPLFPKFPPRRFSRPALAGGSFVFRR